MRQYGRKTAWSLTLAVGFLLVLISTCLVIRLWRQNASKQQVQTAVAVNCEDHPMTVTLVSEKPRIILFDKFVSDKEIEELLAVGQPRLKRSTVLGGKGSEVSDIRTSSTAYLDRGMNPTVSAVERRASVFSGLPKENIEPLQYLEYSPGQFYKTHYDYFDPGSPGASDALKRGGQRRVTYFVYLSDVAEGGHTYFPKLNKKFAPKKGMAVMWHNTKPDNTVDKLTFHSGEPPISGTKQALNIWIRERAFM